MKLNTKLFSVTTLLFVASVGLVGCDMASPPTQPGGTGGLAAHTSAQLAKEQFDSQYQQSMQNLTLEQFYNDNVAGKMPGGVSAQLTDNGIQYDSMGKTACLKVGVNNDTSITDTAC